MKTMKAYRLSETTLRQIAEMASKGADATQVITEAIEKSYQQHQKEQTMSKFYEVSAGSGYGTRTALYEVVEGILVLRNEGDHDNLSGNGIALDFEGLTPIQAAEKATAINGEPVPFWLYLKFCRY